MNKKIISKIKKQIIKNKQKKIFNFFGLFFLSLGTIVSLSSVLIACNKQSDDDIMNDAIWVEKKDNPGVIQLIFSKNNVPKDFILKAQIILTTADDSGSQLILKNNSDWNLNAENEINILNQKILNIINNKCKSIIVQYKNNKMSVKAIPKIANTIVSAAWTGKKEGIDQKTIDLEFKDEYDIVSSSDFKNNAIITLKNKSETKLIAGVDWDFYSSISKIKIKSDKIFFQIYNNINKCAISIEYNDISINVNLNNAPSYLQSDFYAEWTSLSTYTIDIISLDGSCIPSSFFSSLTLNWTKNNNLSNTIIIDNEDLLCSANKIYIINPEIIKKISTISSQDNLEIKYLKNGNQVSVKVYLYNAPWNDQNIITSAKIQEKDDSQDIIYTIIIQFSSTIDDFSTNFSIYRYSVKLDNNDFTFKDNNITFTVKDKTDIKNVYAGERWQIQYKNFNLVEIDTSQVTKKSYVELFDKNNQIIADEDENNIDKLNTIGALNLDLQKKINRYDIVSIVAFGTKAASELFLTANINDEENDNWGNLKTIDLSKVIGLISMGALIYNDKNFNGKIILPPNLLSIATTLDNDNVYGFLYNCISFNQPLVLPNSLAEIGDGFLYNCISFNQPLVLPNLLTKIGNNFLNSCFSFNQPIILPDGIDTINSNFLQNCKKFNESLKFPSFLNKISDNFLNSCSSFNYWFTLPNYLTEINKGFLSFCSVFNQPITLPDNLKLIDDKFLQNCSCFNQPLNLSTLFITSIGSYFLASCTNFNQPLVLCNSLNSIKNDFLSGDSSPESSIITAMNFNQIIYFSSSLNLTEIGDNFLFNCSSFNQPLTLPDSLKNIGNNFLNYCSSFNQKIIFSSSSNVTWIGDNFLFNCSSFNQPLTLPDSLKNIEINFLGFCKNFNQQINFSKKLVLIKDNFLFNCSNFNSLLNFSNIESSNFIINSNFLSYCSAFNQILNLPVNLKRIDESFMLNCSSFAQDLNLPKSLEYIGINFIENCSNFINKTIKLSQELKDTYINDEIFKHLSAVNIQFVVYNKSKNIFTF